MGLGRNSGFVCVNIRIKGILGDDSQGDSSGVGVDGKRLIQYLDEAAQYFGREP